ncbi:hypothetical protein HIM_03985 [Hirsutella minnesotensis 3608]|uniref:CHRD domain-containing protein n=1 Tax=Hirsutella minnesotensis 3608 TaxID=1043627 RepID=A0A0F8A687_9HYPO|nr:hypothetical protein HIM_03985 [Hirsutella minnesotensis 3608]
MKSSVLAICLPLVTAVPCSPHVKPNEHVEAPSPFYFTSVFSVVARSEEVVDSNKPFTGGLQGAIGLYNFGINSQSNVICYNITLDGLRGNYQSPAKTATHIHEAAAGKSGPPRIAFPNPEGPESGRRSSIGCVKEPFVMGVKASDKDTGEGFHVLNSSKGNGLFDPQVYKPSLTT